MAELLTDTPNTSAFGLGDIFYAVFKHKWKILICAVIGFIAAFVVQSQWAPVYESHAKLLVRYVLERTPIDPIDATSGKSTDSVIGSEVEILTSWDLAMQVADAIGVKRLLPGSDGTASKTEAAATVSSGLSVGAGRGSNIIFVAYKNPNPELVTLVLDELLSRYFTKHLEVHRSAGAFDFVTQQADQVHTRLNETEDALKALKAKAGIVSYADSTAALSSALQKVQEMLYTAEEETAFQRTRVKRMEEAGASAPDPSKEAPAKSATSGDVQRYQAIVSRLGQLRQAELDLLSKFTDENILVKFNREQIADLEKQKIALQEKFPDLAASAAPSGSPPATVGSEKARLADMELVVESLKARLANVREGIKRLSEVGSQIADLERNQELEIANYKYFKGTLEKARIDEALDPSKMPNISTVQRPSPPSRVYGKRDKVVRYVAGGGLGLALAIVLLSELFLNQTVKRPLELEKRLGTRLLIAIPFASAGRRFRLPWKKQSREVVPLIAKNGTGLAPWDPGHFIRPYSEAIRDRLGLYFELNRMTHKPKLVGVTSFAKGAGTSTLAAGLAAALSETGDGKVLLVDVNLGPGEVHPFFNGRPALPLTAALESNGSLTSAADNLYLATVGSSTAGPAQLGLKKFFDLMPNLQASDFDYVIFDMPPLGQTSPTMGMAGFMDKMLLVVEGEKNNRDAVRRGYEALVASRDNVSVVFNKARSYIPQWLHSDS